MDKTIFRGKTFDGRWVFGLPTYLVEENYDNKIIDGIRVDFETNEDIEPKSLGQFTGLYDKNGMMIYSGDILKSNRGDNFYLYGDYALVEYMQGSFFVSMVYDMTPLQLYDYDKVYKTSEFPLNTHKSDWLEEFEVVGNYTDNKKLLVV